MTFTFTRNADKSVTMHGCAPQNIKEIAGEGQIWRVWCTEGQGYQSGRHWCYGESSINIIKTNGNVRELEFSFSLGRKWKEGRKIITEIVEKLNQNPHAEHETYLRTLEEITRDWKCQNLELKPIDRLKKAIAENHNEKQESPQK